MAATLAAATIEQPAPTPPPPGHTYMPTPAPTAALVRTSDAELAEYWAKVAAQAETAPVGADRRGKRAAAASTTSATLWDGTLSQDVPMEVSQSPPGLAADSTGLSQGVGAVSLHPDSPAACAGRHTTAIELRRGVLEHFLEAEIGRHLDLAQATQGAHSHVAVQFPGSWEQLHILLRKAAFDVDSRDAWQTLGFAFMEGPCPTEQSIMARARAGRLLCGLAHSASWAPACKAAADRAAHRIETAAADCQAGLPDLQRARNKLRQQLPMHKELDTVALDLLRNSGTAGELYLTQWSSVLPSTTLSATDIQNARTFATLAERGDAAAWRSVAGHAVAFWVPEDPSQAARLLKSFLEIADPALRPRSVRMIAPIPLVAGAKSVDQVLDLWHSPLLLGRWSSVVRHFTITTTPMGMVLPNNSGPRHAHMGLAIFHISHDMPRADPCLMEPLQPLLTIAAQRVAIVDTPAECLPKLLAALQAPGFQGVRAREPSRSPLSIPGLYRVSLRLVFPPQCSELEILVQLSALRGLDFGADTFYGLQDMAGAKDSLILEIGNAANFKHYWTVCSQAIALSAKRFLVQSEAEPKAWTALMDAILGRDADDATAKLKYKASVNSGRTVAIPTAISSALAAARRGANRRITTADCAASVSVQGELGHEDTAVLQRIMAHLAQSTGLAIAPATDAAAPRIGEFFADPDGRAGSVKVLLPDLESVRRVYAALDGQTVMAGSDRLAIRVQNDAVGGKAVPGGQLRRH